MTRLERWLTPFGRWESWSIIAGNLLPILGIVWLGWDASTLIILYWMETAVIGLWTVLRLAVTPQEKLPRFGAFGANDAHVDGLGLGLFLLLHAGFFMGIHMFMLSGIAPGEWSRHLASPVAFVTDFVIPTGLWIPLAGLCISRGAVTLHEIRMQRPAGHFIAGFYARIILMQMVILMGGMLALLLDSPAVLLMLIVVFKTIVEVYWEGVSPLLEGAFASQKRQD